MSGVFLVFLVCYKRSLKMFSNKILLISTRSRANSLRKFSKLLSNFWSRPKTTIDNGILLSDSDDIVIPSVSLNEFIFQATEPFEKYKAIVSILIFFI